MKRRISCLVSAACLAITPPALAQKDNRTLLAVFAHADDESVVSPLLAHYARQGVDVYLAIVTRGEKWAPQTRLSPGDPIARVRAEEARCAARALDIHPPILLPFDDGSLGERVMPPWATLSKVESRLRELVADLKPDVVVTWGPEGGYGHPEHRLVGDLVTELVQRKVEGAPRHLLYVGIPSGRVPADSDLPWLPVDMEYLTVQVPYTDADLSAAKSSFACYKSQLPEEALRRGPVRLHNEVWQGRIYLRPWFGEVHGDDLFALDARGARQEGRNVGGN